MPKTLQLVVTRKSLTTNTKTLKEKDLILSALVFFVVKLF